jgi:hypothetical protein
VLNGASAFEINVVTGDYVLNTAAGGGAVPVNFTFTDGDGDLVSGNLSLTSQVGDAGLASVGSARVGTRNDNTLVGTAEADVLVGGFANGATGADVMTGGGGADNFVWRFYDNRDPLTAASSYVAPSRYTDATKDYITDFKVGQYVHGASGANAADRLDLSGMLQGETTSNLANYINVTFDGTNTVLNINSEGGFTGGVYDPNKVNQVIILQNVDLGGSTSEDRLSLLLANGQLVIG